MMFSGVIQVFKDKLGSSCLFEKITVTLVALALFILQVYLLIRDPLLLIAYVLAWGFFFFTIQRYECVRCINIECPMNRVQAEERKYVEKKNFAKSFEEIYSIDGLYKIPMSQERYS